MNAIQTTAALIALACGLHAQEPQDASFQKAAASVQQRLHDSVAELSALREDIAAETIPLSRQLGELEAELGKVRAEFQQTTRVLDSRALDLNNLRGEIKSRNDENTYLQSLLGDYIRNFESRLHIAEIQRYEEPLEAAKLAPENSSLTEQQVFEVQGELLTVSLERLHEALGGVSFPGTAVDADGLVEEGTFTLLGPAAIFRTNDGDSVGTAEQRLGSLEPAVIPFSDAEHASAAARLAESGAGTFPLDPTLGNAHKIAATEETLWEHIQKGGPVMVPILAMAAAAMLVALYKWIALAFVRRPSKKQMKKLLDAVDEGDKEAALERAGALKGPIGEMLRVGAAHLGEPRELIEEVMHETMLKARLRLNRMLPFVAVCAAAAPLLGLLGTVTGIINTFTLITVFGSGDVKTLSGGISEALITTEFGLIVAIPSLLLHAYLSRKAKGIVGRMESSAIAFVNHAARARHVLPAPAAHAASTAGTAAPDASLVRAQVEQILREMLGPLAQGAFDDELERAQAARAR